MPPFFKSHENPGDAPRSCFTKALQRAFEEGERVATPLLGAGARCFAIDEAVLSVAATAAGEWCEESDGCH
jgi:hypothetical protein